MFATRLVWQSNASAFQGGILIVMVAGWLFVILRRLAQRHPPPGVWFLFIPKLWVALLLLLLFFDPAWLMTGPIDRELRFLAVIDNSTSMEVIDRDGLSRLARAQRIVSHLERRLPDMTIDKAFFNDRLIESAAPPDDHAPVLRNTDLAQVLVDLGRQSSRGMFDGAVLLTDGGDERFDPFRMPSLPHYIVAVGNEAGLHSDVAIEAVDVPVFAEAGADTDCRVSLRSYGDADFLRRLGRLRLDLQERSHNGESWLPVTQELVDLRNGMAEVSMTIAGTDEVGERDFRVLIEASDGELTPLNNERHFSIMVEHRHWRVLLYSRRLDRSIAELRRMLAAEPGVSLTSLLRLRDEVYAAQTDMIEPDGQLESFPDSADRLQGFRCLIIGSFPADEWSEAQMQALVDFVADGGSVVFLGGEYAFGHGGYASTPLRVLFPWVVRGDEPEPVRGAFEVAVAPAVVQQGMIPGWTDVMRMAHPLLIHSMNRPGRLRAGAVGLLNALYEGEQAPVIAFQPYGRGRVMGVATDTLWRWRMAGREARAAYNHFWSNAIRFLAGREQGGRFLRVNFDRDSYHPGERAEIRVQVPGHHPEGRVRVQVEKQFGDDRQPVPLEYRPGASPSFVGYSFFAERGTYAFSVTAWIDHDPMETFVRTMWVGSRVNEGANIDVDHAFLAALATRSGQSVIREDNLAPLVEQLTAHRLRSRRRQAEPLVQYRGIYLMLLIVGLIAEWIIRSRQARKGVRFSRTGNSTQ